MPAPLDLLKSALPEGIPVPVRWLHGLGISSAAIHAQVKGKWLNPLAGRAYARPGPALTWQSYLFGAQQTGSVIHVGNLSALALHGLAHYLALGGQEQVHLYHPARPPKWLQAIPADVHWHHEQIIQEPSPIQRVASSLREPRLDIPAAQLLGVEKQPAATPCIFISSPERAALEVAADLTRGGSWDSAYEVFTGLTNLRPTLVQKLLEACRSKVTRRIFLHLAHTSGHAWLKALDETQLDLGTGDRQVVSGGQLDQRYRITVPARWQHDAF